MTAQLTNDNRFRTSSEMARPTDEMMFHEMYLAGNPATLYAEAGVAMVWIGIGDGKSRPLPEWMLAHLTPTSSTSP